MIASRTIKVSGKPGTVTIQDLRDLVKETAHLPADHYVSVKAGTSDIRDSYPAELTVTWTDSDVSSI